MSPSNQNLSYNQQQQIHRTAGLQRLTADLAGLQFNDAEALLKNYAQTTRQGGGSGSAKAAAAQINRSPTLVGPATGTTKGRHSPTRQGAAEHEPTGPTAAKEATATTQQPQPATTVAGGYDEQMIVSAGGGSQFSDHDPAKDAQETSDDAALLKRYKIVQLIGTGNYARVYKALTQTGRELAVKVINLSKTSDNYRQKFLPRELAILKRISHSNICKTHEISHISDRVFIIMQYCSNGTIADLVHRIGPFSEPVARFLFAPVIEAVAYLHSMEFAHRDLKVENILLDGDYNPKLTDFSYSINTNPSAALNLEIKHVTQLTQKQNGSRSNNSLKHGGPGCSHQPPLINKHQQQVQTQTTGGGGGSPSRAAAAAAAAAGGIIKLNETFCGTLPYLSPEMIRQYPYDAKKTDVWSLGICLYVMLNDRLPFPFNDVRLMIKKQMSKDYKFRTNLEFSEQIRDLMAQILEPDFSRRTNCADIGRHPWFNGPRERPV